MPVVFTVWTVLASKIAYRGPWLRHLLTVENDEYQVAVVEFTYPVTDKSADLNKQFGARAVGYLSDGTRITLRRESGFGEFPGDEFEEFRGQVFTRPPAEQPIHIRIAFQTAVDATNT